MDDLAGIDGAEELLCPRTVRVLKQARDLLMSRLFLEEFQERAAVHIKNAHADCSAWA
jgi:hypothetical protein